MIRRRVTVHGNVQGVFFRDTCREQAEAAGVTGWVRNTSTGTVEAVFEGESEAVDRLVEWCEHGPPRAEVERAEVERAEVERVEVDEEEPRAEPGFTVR